MPRRWGSAPVRGARAARPITRTSPAELAVTVPLGAVATLAAHDAPVRGCAVGPDGTWVVASSGGELRLWDVEVDVFYTHFYRVVVWRITAEII